ncbi:hypothetical protein [Aeromonas veronii]|uniref:hypothetical protein n=1 Tax=Aeromonas veronii TaxID=654 RepID=UPI002B4A4653|nr:hypothetical protein [Aeromonas veronii]
MDIHQILTTALNKRSIFHSEADFQHHLAWEIHRAANTEVDVRLEFPLSSDHSNRWEYCDILVRGATTIGVELKYKTKKLSIEVGSEQFELKQQGAQDLGRYDFLKDICRLESWCEQKKIAKGYAILLTNDPSYWLVPKQSNTIDRAFRLHCDVVQGVLGWESSASEGTTKGREANLVLKNRYSLTWFDTERLDFKYLLVEIKR